MTTSVVAHMQLKDERVVFEIASVSQLKESKDSQKEEEKLVFCSMDETIAHVESKEFDI